MSNPIAFVVQKTVGRFVENTILKFAAVSIGQAYGLPIVAGLVDQALSHDQPVALQRVLLLLKERLDVELVEGGVGQLVMPPMWRRDP